MSLYGWFFVFLLGFGYGMWAGVVLILCTDEFINRVKRGKVKTKKIVKELNPTNIVKKYPNLFRDYGGDMRTTCMSFGFEVQGGWLPLIDSIGQQLTDLGVERYVIADQVKEKFGSLQLYYHTENLPLSIWDWRPINRYFVRIWYHKYSRWIKKHLTKLRKLIFGLTLYEKISDIIETAETKSYKICEICGADGKTNSQGWLKTLCGGCRNGIEVGR